MEGTGFTDGDFIRIKVICPYVTSSEYGEQTYGASYDSFWLLKSDGGSSWGTLSASDGCDINGDYLDSGSQSMSSLYLSQQTPYVFTAQTWSVERKFVAGSNLVLLYSPIRARLIIAPPTFCGHKATSRQALRACISTSTT